jgi:pyridoxal phosphate enzyme (YggS family)
VSDPAALRARLDGVRERVAAAAHRAGRDRDSIRLVAISKTFPADAVRAAAHAGQIDFGENKVQEAAQKIAACADLDVSWHLVGHLQSNKARKAAALFNVIHSVDSTSLALKLDEAAGEANRTVNWLIQVDLAGEATKHGARPDDLEAIVSAAHACRSARLIGLMLLPPAVEDPEAARPYFRSLVRLRDQLVRGGLNPAMLSELSMGMSHDFEIAIEEGATMVRVGSAIFGQRHYP